MDYINKIPITLELPTEQVRKMSRKVDSEKLESIGFIVVLRVEVTVCREDVDLDVETVA